MASSLDGLAHNGPLALATRDYGGDGPDLLFVPGAGQTLVDCDLLAPTLTAHHRVVSMDLRGHGLAGDGDFSWEAALDDIDAVIATLGLERPVVVGHSLGGMLAAMHGARHPDSRGVVNLDGHGEGSPHQYEGMAPELVAARLAELQGLRETALAGAGDAQTVLPDAVLEVMVQHYQALYGLPEAFVREVLARSHVRCEGGLRPRVTRELTLDIVTAVQGLDLSAAYRQCAAPLLVVNAVRPQPAAPGSPAWMPEHLAAYRRGISLELRELCAERPTMAFVELDVTHALVYEEPELVAKHILAFLSEVV